MTREFDKTIAFIGGSGLAQGLEGLLEGVSHHQNMTNIAGEIIRSYGSAR